MKIFHENLVIFITNILMILSISRIINDISIFINNDINSMSKVI